MHDLNKSKKIFRGIKCDYPGNTIERIKKAFRRLRITPAYSEAVFSCGGIKIFSGHLTIPNTGIFANGKGTSSILSKASAYAELIERFSTVALLPYAGDIDEIALSRSFLNYEYLQGCKRISHRRGGDIIDIDSLLPRSLELSKAIHDRLLKEPTFRTFVDAYDLNNKTLKKVPIEFISCISRTNGLAAGNTIEEAISQALSEVIERHAGRELVINRKPAPNIDHRSIVDPINKKYLTMFKSLGRRVVLKDLSLGMGLPAVGMIVINDEFRHSDNPFLRRQSRRVTVGCHADINEALRRCFVEELQGYDKKTYVEMDRHQYDTFWNEWCMKHECLNEYSDQSNLYEGIEQSNNMPWDSEYLESPSDTVGMSDLPSYPSEDASIDVSNLCGVLSSNGFESYFVDFTHPVLRFPTVRVIVPGMSDMIAYEDKRWVDESGVVDFILSVDSNIIDYANEDEWTGSLDGIAKLLNVLERRFIRHGYEDEIVIGNDSIWLFYLAYRLSLFFKDFGKSLRYLRFIQRIYPERNAELSKQMLRYLNYRAGDLSEENALNQVAAKYGTPWRRRIKDIIEAHDLRRVTLNNPLSPTASPISGKFTRWIKSFFKTLPHSNTI